MTVDGDDAFWLTDDERAALALTDLHVPDGFADRVLAGRAPRPRRRTAIALAAAVAIVLVPLVAWRLRDGATSDSAGEHVAVQRSTVALGARATAVAERGAELSWRIDDDRAVTIQRRGDVFYRVDRGGPPFVVETPAGTVTVEGTCFRIALAGDAITSAVVTVYEGRVALATASGALRLSAGERGVARSGSMPALAPLAAPASHARELEALRARVRELEARTPEAPDSDDAADPVRLAAMADECRVAWDLPSFEGDGELATRAHAAVLQIPESDRQRLDRALTDLRARSLDTMRRLYIETTGDPDHAEQLSWTALLAEIDHKSSTLDLQRAFQRISAERAGFATPPTTLAGTTPVERKYRLLISIGDETERLVATVLGATRAHALRAMNGGWAMRSTASPGCPID